MTNEQKEKIYEMRKEGMSYSKIVLTLRISENTVKSYCRRNNLGAVIKNEFETPRQKNTVCMHCGKALKLGMSRKLQKFCSEECRRTWWKGNDELLKRKAYYTLVCAECCKEFKSYGNKKRKYCSHACYINARFRKGGNADVARAV